jgi:spermidine synthase
VAIAAVVAWSFKINARLPHAGLGSDERLLAVKVSREGVVAVVEADPDDRRILFNNTYTLGGSRAQFNQERQALLPILLHGSARRVATLGVATGSTVAGATLDPEVERIDGIELSPLALEYADRYFSPFNRDVFRNPRVHFTAEDARWAIARNRRSYDVVIGDLFLPWRTGEGRLYTREHFANVHASLRPGGLFCQWLPMFQLTHEQFDCIVRTFRTVFPDSLLVRGDFYVGMPIVGLIGGRTTGTIDWAKVGSSAERVRFADDCHDPLLRHVEGIAMCIVGDLPAPPPGPMNTLSNGWLEWNAGRNIVGLREPWFVGVPYARYLRDIHESAERAFPASLQSAHAAGHYFLKLEVGKAAKLPAADQLERETHLHLPAKMRHDEGAAWRYWPMRHRPKLP